MSNEVFQGLAHVALYTDKYEDTINFYTKILPFTLVKELTEERPDDTSGFYPFKFGLVKLNDLYIEILECADKRNWNDLVGPFHHIGICVKDIDKAISFLESRGLQTDRIPKPGVNSTLYPGKAYRSCSFLGDLGERIGLYEFDNKDFFEVE